MLICHRSKRKKRNHNAELLSIRPLHHIRPIHTPFHRFQYAIAVVLVRASGINQGLFADDSIPLHLFSLPHGMSDDPMTFEKLNRCRPEVLNTDEVCKDKLMLDRFGLAVEIHRADCNFDIVRDCSV